MAHQSCSWSTQALGGPPMQAICCRCFHSGSSSEIRSVSKACMMFKRSVSWSTTSWQTADETRLTPPTTWFVLNGTIILTVHNFNNRRFYSPPPQVANQTVFKSAAYLFLLTCLLAFSSKHILFIVNFSCSSSFAVMPLISFSTKMWTDLLPIFALIAKVILSAFFCLMQHFFPPHLCSSTCWPWSHTHPAGPLGS